MQKTNNLLWITTVKKILTNIDNDILNNTNKQSNIRYEWRLVEPKSEKFNTIISDAKNILAYNYTEMELEFAKKHPDLVENEFFLQAIKHLFVNGSKNVNWQEAKQKLTSYMKEFFGTTDFKKFTHEQEIQVFVRAYEQKTNKLIGIIQWQITPDYQYGIVKAGLCAIAANMEQSNIHQQLMSSIFCLIPCVKRIILHTRTTNTKHIQRFIQWGFTTLSDNSSSWTNLEYDANSNKVLQQ